MADFKQSWKQAGKSALLALNDLGVSLIDTAKAAYDFAMEWAKKDNIHVSAEAVEVSADKPEQESSSEPEASAK